MSYAAIIGVVGSVVGGAVSGGLSSSGSNKQQGQIQQAYSHLPEVPNLNKEFLTGYSKELQFTPEALAIEHWLRGRYGHADQQAAVDLYRQYGPQYASITQQILNKADPLFNPARKQLYGTVSNDLAAGSYLTPDMQAQIEQGVRGAQTARGNVLGNAPVAAEAFTKGAAGEGLKQQRITNMENFLRGPTPTDKTGGILGPGGAALGMGLATQVNPGYSYIEGPHGWGPEFRNNAQTQYQDALQPALAQANALAGAPPQSNPWMSALSGGLGGLSGSAGGLGGLFGGGGGGGGASGLSYGQGQGFTPNYGSPGPQPGTFYAN